MDRLWAKVDATGVCWEWTAATDKEGYGRFLLDGANRLAHRVVYELLVGAIPTGKQLDHLCRNHICVNPDHLEPVTPRTNILRGVGMGARNAAKDRCPRGHIYDRRSKQGHRWCGTCNLDRKRAARQRS